MLPLSWENVIVYGILFHKGASLSFEIIVYNDYIDTYSYHKVTLSIFISDTWVLYSFRDCMWYIWVISVISCC